MKTTSSPTIADDLKATAGNINTIALVDASAVAKILGVTPRHVRGLAARGDIPHLSIGTGIRTIPRFHLPSVLESLGFDKAVTSNGKKIAQ